MTLPYLLTFDEASEVGRQLHDRFVSMMGSAPLPRDDLGWGDVVQTALRLARDVIDARDEAAGVVRERN